MVPVAQELDERLRTLDPHRAQRLESLVRDLLLQIESGEWDAVSARWPEGYFEQTAGVLAGEKFERPPQGELSERDAW